MSNCADAHVLRNKFITYIFLMGCNIVNENKKIKTVEYGKYGYGFLAPFFIVFLAFQLVPLVYTFAMSFVYSEKVGRNKVTTIIGFGNFKNYVFSGNKEVWISIGITLILWLLNFLPQILLALLLAAWFTDSHNKLKGQGAYKVIMYMPNIITAASIAFLFFALFSVQGTFTSILRNIGIPIADGGLLDHGWYSLFIIAFIQFWMWYGQTMIVLIAGIMGINPSLYEAAMVDGASARQQFFSITLPLLKPILQFTMVTSAIGGLQMYDIPQLFNAGKPVVNFCGQSVDSTKTIVMLIKSYIEAGSGQNLGRASAYSVILFIITLAISMVFYILTSDKKPKKGKKEVK